MKKLETMTAEQLQSAPYAPVPFLVDELIPEGLHILAGAPKIGKSWLALWLCLCVSQGQPLWNFATTQGEALYLSLEDSFQRIQTRLFDLTEDAPPTLHFAIMADTLKHGLEQQIEQFLMEHPTTKLVVIDTLQRVRGTGSDSNLYANDYQDIGLLKRLADRRHIAILLIHHLRKLHDDDPMNMISGSTGLSGAADSTFVLQKSSRLANIASLHCTGRDIADRTLKLEFGEEDHVWKLLEDSKTCSSASKISTLQLTKLLSELLRAGVTDDHIVLALVLFAVLFVFLCRFCFVEHVFAACAFFFDGGLFEHHHKVGKSLIRNDLSDTGKRKIAQKIFPVHTDRRSGKAQLVGGLLQTDKVCAFQVRTHHVTQTGNGDFLFVMEAHHCEAGSRTVGSVVLPDVGITHRCFL